MNDCQCCGSKDAILFDKYDDYYCRQCVAMLELHDKVGEIVLAKIEELKKELSSIFDKDYAKTLIKEVVQSL